MKTIPIALAPQYSGAGSTLCRCMKMTLRDGAVIGATSIDVPLTIDGLVYQPWLDVSDLVSTATLGVDNLELKIETDEEWLMRDLEAGRYDNASFSIFETNYKNPTDGQLGLKRGTTGNVQIGDNGRYTLEFRGLTQALQQTVGIVTNRTCRANFADFPRMALSAKCGLDPAPWTVKGTVTATNSPAPGVSSSLGTLSGVINESAFSDGTVTTPTGFFTGGLLSFTSGLNVGRSRVVSSDSGGTFTTELPFPSVPSVGDSYSVSPADFTPANPTNTMTDSGRTEAADWFGAGVVTMTGGLNAGYRRQVASFSAGGIFLFNIPFPFQIQIGDGYEAIAGCRKRHNRSSALPSGPSDCIDKFNNILNFQGEAHLPGVDALTKIPGIGT